MVHGIVPLSGTKLVIITFNGAEVLKWEMNNLLLIIK